MIVGHQRTKKQKATIKEERRASSLKKAEKESKHPNPVLEKQNKGYQKTMKLIANAVAK